MIALTTSTSPRRQRGFSLVELMVSVVIGLLALVFATRLMLGGEQSKQGSLGGSDAMQNGMLALFSISNDLAQSGFGLNDPIVAGCNTVFSDSNGYQLDTATRGASTIRPLGAVVINNVAGGSDRISTYSGSSLTGAGTLGITDYPGAGIINVDRVPYGFNQGDVVLAAPDAPADGGDCAIAMVNTDPRLLLPPPSQQFINIGGVGGRFSTGTLGAPMVSSRSRLFNLGPAANLSFHTWSVSGGFLQLRATDLAGASAAPTTVIDNVVALKAQYGFDMRAEAIFNDDQTGVQQTGLVISRWSSTMMDADNDGISGDPDDYQRMAAVRIAVVARSPSPEKPVGGVCDATPAAMSVFTTNEPAGIAAVPVPVSLAVTGDTVDWKCYRYRVFETIVPLRNVGWRPTATMPTNP